MKLPTRKVIKGVLAAPMERPYLEHMAKFICDYQSNVFKLMEGQKGGPWGITSPKRRMRAVELMTAQTPPPRMESRKIGRVSLVLGR